MSWIMMRRIRMALAISMAAGLAGGVAVPAGAGSPSLRTVCFNKAPTIEQAIEVCSALIDAGGLPILDQVYARHARGNALAAKGQYEQAIADYSQAIRLMPDYATLYGVRGGLYDRLGRYDLALQDFDRAVALDPTDPDLLVGRCYTMATVGRFEPALADCRAALRLTPQATDPYDAEGFVHLRMKNYESARAAYDRALALDPKLPSALYGRGLAKQKLGERAGGSAEIAAAKVHLPGIVEEFTRRGVQQ